MKPEIHPDYVECTVRCSCGNEFTTHSTKPELRIDICNVCHPFYTGTQKLIDTGGRVQRFANRFGGSAIDTVTEREAAKKAERAAKTAEREAAKKAEREAKLKEKEERAAKFAAEAAKAPKAEEAIESDAVTEEVVDKAITDAPAEEVATEEVAEVTENAPEEAAEEAAEEVEAETEEAAE